MLWLKLTVEEVREHARNTWHLYASEVRAYTLTRLYYNGFGIFRVAIQHASSGLEEEIVGETSSLSIAVAIFNNQNPKWTSPYKK